MREATAALGGQVDILVNNACVYPVTPTESLSDADLDAILHTNIRAPYVLVGEVASGMVGRDSGFVVNIGPWMGRIGTANGAMYTASKAAVEQIGGVRPARRTGQHGGSRRNPDPWQP